MAMRPNFDSVELRDSKLVVTGQSADDPLPLEIRVFIEQDGRVAPRAGSGGVDQVSASWTATLDAEGFHAGPALAFGVEVRTLPFQATSWSQFVSIQ
jgi:hypothetical protein